MRSMRLVMLALAALVALQGVAADADCLGDGATCSATESCPKVCCTGMPARTSGSIMHCPAASAVFRATTANNFTGGGIMPLAAPTIAPVITDPPAPIEADPLPVVVPAVVPPMPASVAPTPAPVPVPAAPVAPPPPPAGRTDSVDAFQSVQTLSGQRSGPGGGASTAVIVVAALAGCVVLVVAVMFKRKTAKTPSLESPGSGYHGANNGANLTPDNRSLDGMMEMMEPRGSNDSMKQLPVLSLAGREGSSIARLSSPFGQNTARISSPAYRGATNEDYAFDVEMGARPGSSVQVAFVDVRGQGGDQNTEFSVEPNSNGVVAL